jgi:hypothetical protein
MADQTLVYSQTEVVNSYEFTTLEGLHQAIQEIAYEHPDISRGEVYPEDPAGHSIGRLRLRRNTLGDGSFTYDAIIGPVNSKSEVR